LPKGIPRRSIDDLPFVKLKTRRLANYINLMEGYRTLEIATPEEVIGYE